MNNALKNIYLIKSKKFKTNMKRLKIEPSTSSSSFVYLSRILLTSFVFISGYMQTRKTSSIT